MANNSLNPKMLRVNTIGMDQRARDALDLFFRNICHEDYSLKEGDDVDVTIIDMDAVNAEQLRAEHFERHPARPTILISLLEIEVDNGVFLKKPLQPGELKAALERLRENIATSDSTDAPEGVAAAHSSTPEVRMSKPTPWTSSAKQSEQMADPAPQKQSRSGEIIPLFPDVLQKGSVATPSWEAPTPPAGEKKKEKAAFLYDPMNHLQGYIEKAYRIAIEQNRNVLLEGPWRPIIIMPETREIWVEQSHAHLYALAVMPVHAEDVTIRVLDEGELPPEQSGSIQPLEPFLWKLAVRTARGRIPAGTDLRAPVSLRHWPNLSRLMPIRHGLRISALWTKQPVSLVETAALLDIAPKYIFSFYSAARALDLIEQRERGGGERDTKTSSPQTPEHRGFLSKILARLRGRGR